MSAGKELFASSYSTRVMGLGTLIMEDVKIIGVFVLLDYLFDYLERMGPNMMGVGYGVGGGLTKEILCSIKLFLKLVTFAAWSTSSMLIDGAKATGG